MTNSKEEEREKRKARDKKYRDNNKEKISERQKKWREKNREKISVQKKEYRENNKEKTREQSKRYRENNKEKIKIYRKNNREKLLEQIKDWRKQNKEHIEKYYEKNKERIQAYCKEYSKKNKLSNAIRINRRRAVFKNASGYSTKEQIQARFDYHGNKCYYCGDSSCKLQIEHRIPLSRGGSNWPANIVPACKHCNNKKHTKTEREFKEKTM